MQTTTSRKRIPDSPGELLAALRQFQNVLKNAKQFPIDAVNPWYPFPTAASLEHLLPAISGHFERFRRSLECGRVLDIGCADGDLTFFFASLGCDVESVDMRESNFNWMNGVHTLRERLGYQVEIREMDLDQQFSLPHENYGLVLFLGLLYHLKNPFYVLEHLARASRYCVLSTRIAQRTPSRTSIQKEPVAYLVDDRETNDDSTNFWIFSEAGLLRLIKRAGWRVLGSNKVGSQRSNPVDPDADERMFLFLRSQRCSAPAEVVLLEGWTEPVPQKWAWTEKRFTFEVRLHENSRPATFLLGFRIPPAIANVSPVTLTCRINGISAAAQVYRKHGDQVLEAPFPEAVDCAQPMLFEFLVEHEFDPRPDERDLGVIMPFTSAIAGTGTPIPFWMD
jgi:tRNA (mo5U34)-methyltransferase